ncbi:MAG: minor capsid protein [Ruminococcus sp.]|nr:minor capsid protein [Ruminococcus sp.]
MSTPSNIYWADRQAQLAAGMAKDEKRLYAKFSAYYEREAARLDKAIAAFYAQYGEGNILEYRQLLQSLSDADRRLLMERMDEFAKKYPEYAHLLSVREDIYKLSRLEGLRQSIAMQQLEMGAYEQQQAQAFFTKQSQRFANGAAEMMGYGTSFYSIDSDMVKLAVGNPWCSGKSFSERIWDNRTKLTQTLQSEVVNGIIRGDDYHKTSRILQEKFKTVSKNNIERLVFTEDTYLQNESAMNVFASDPDFEEYTFMARKNASPCDLCKALSGKTFRIEERRPGENFPPMHPWCGCTFTIPQLDIRKVLENGRKRAAEKAQRTLTSGADGGIMRLNRELERRDKNIGAFADLEIPMQKKHVLNLCEKYNINTKGITFKIQRSESLLALPFYGSTDYNDIGRIDLFPNAFTDEEQLIRTVIHEKCHVEQLKKYGKKYTQKHLQEMEKQAYRFENIYYIILRRRSQN